MPEKAAPVSRKNVFYSFLIRWWSAGAVYFFIGWGTSLGQRDSIIDMAFILGVSIGVFNTFVVHPVLKMVFNIGWHRSYAESTISQRALIRFKDIGLSLVTTILVTLLYQGINIAAIQLFDLSAEQVYLPGEPILFGLFYAAITMILIFIARLIGQLISRKGSSE